MLSAIELALLNATEYKKYHESLMENNHGSSALHTFLCIFFTVQCTILCSFNRKTSEWGQYLFEYVFIILPLIIIHTVFTEYVILLNFLVLTVLFYKVNIGHYPNLNYKTFKSLNVFKTRRIYSVSCMRGLTYLITIFCILAVDFVDFPRNLAKTEKYGYSLMDTGVGLFVFMSGLVHKDVKADNFGKVIISNTKLITVLLILGVGRFLSVKNLDYQEHVSEYGVHWNFFFTLAVCKLLSSILLLCSNSALLLSIVILTVHELLLYFKLEKWVFSDLMRDSIVNANREGISSSFGYIAMYLFAVYIKKEITNTTRYRYEIISRLILGATSLWVLSFSINLYRPISRTLANAGYCLYSEAILVTVLTVLYFFEVSFENTGNFDVPIILSTINDNGLLYFLVANLLTGAVNLTIRTLLMSSAITFVILNMYMIVTIILIVYLKKKGIKL